MCGNCKDIILRERFYSPRDYLNCLSYIAGLLDSGGFVMLEQTCALDAVKDEAGRWADDSIHHKIGCKHCGEWFLAWADTYHGNGGFVKQDERLRD